MALSGTAYADTEKATAASVHPDFIPTLRHAAQLLDSNACCFGLVALGFFLGLAPAALAMH